MSTVSTARPRQALGMPAGSIRALLAFGVLGYLWALALVHGQDGKPILTDKRASQAFIYLQVLMVLILAHFFIAHGKTIGGHLGGSPLGLPRGSVRFLLLGGYLGLAYYTYTTQPDFQIPETGPVLLMLAILLTAFILGHAVTSLMLWSGKGLLPAWFQDIQAWFALMGVILMGIVVIVRVLINASMPLERQLDPNVVESILAGVVGFYFGARS